MKNIDSIIIHCTATKEGVNFNVSDIDRMHKQRGFSEIGYHYLIGLDGTVMEGRKLPKDGAHCNTKGFSSQSYNFHSVGVCYVGGLDSNGKPKDTRTEAQKKSLRELVNDLCSRYHIIEVLGHRDTSPDKNGNGEVEPFEFIKSCPCFDVKREFPTFLDNITIKP